MAELDEVEIVQVLNRYGFLLDAQQWDMFDRVFTPDLKAEFGPAGLVWPNLDTLLEHFVEFHQRLDSHQHTTMGHLVHVDGERAYAFSYGEWLLRRAAVDGEPTWVGKGWYDDELVRTDFGWRISRRVCRLVSWSGNPAVSGHNPDADMGLHVLHRDVAAGKVGFFRAIAGTKSEIK